MSFVTPNTPNLVDFESYITNTVAIPASAWPSSTIADSPYPGYALNQAIALVPPYCGAVPGITYVLAVYNCATALLFLITPNTPPSTYFSDARQSGTSENFPAGGFNLNAPSTGLVVSSSDEGTSVSLTAPTWAAGLTVTQLGFFKTVWGQQYLGYLQEAGPVIVGVT